MVQEGTALYCMRQYDKTRRLRILSVRDSHDKADEWRTGQPKLDLVAVGRIERPTRGL